MEMAGQMMESLSWRCSFQQSPTSLALFRPWD